MRFQFCKLLKDALTLKRVQEASCVLSVQDRILNLQNWNPNEYTFMFRCLRTTVNVYKKHANISYVVFIYNFGVYCIHH